MTSIIEKVRAYLDKVLVWHAPDLATDASGASWSRRLADLADAKLERQYAMALHEMRIQQAKTLFEEIPSYRDAVTQLMGQAASKVLEISERKNHAFSFFHLQNVEMVPGWGSDVVSIFTHQRNQKTWLPFPKKIETWRVVQHFDLDQISIPMPGKVAAAINHLKRQRFFNAFRGFESSDGRVLILGELWELTPKDGKPAMNAGKTVPFLVAHYTKAG